MTADYHPFEHAFLGRMAARIVDEARGINRVTVDIIGKPPGAIERERGQTAAGSMKPLKYLRDLLLPRKPVPVVEDPILGALTWDVWNEAWMSSAVPPARHGFQINRFGRLPTPHPRVLDVAYELARNPARFERHFRERLAAEAERMPEAMRAGILRLGVTRITMGLEAHGGVVGFVYLDGKPPLDDLVFWHLDGNPGGFDGTTE